MRNNFKWTLLFLSLIAIGNIFSCSNAQHEKKKSEEQPIAKKESEIIYSGLAESEIQEGDFDGYGIQVNRVEVRPVLDEELKVEVDTPYGKYTMHIESTENKFNIYRELIIYKGKYPASEYQDIKDFMKQIRKLDNAKLVLKSTE